MYSRARAARPCSPGPITCCKRQEICLRLLQQIARINLLPALVVLHMHRTPMSMYMYSTPFFLLLSSFDRFARSEPQTNRTTKSIFRAFKSIIDSFYHIVLILTVWLCTQLPSYAVFFHLPLPHLPPSPPLYLCLFLSPHHSTKLFRTKLTISNPRLANIDFR